jgi:hypothetical protein
VVSGRGRVFCAGAPSASAAVWAAPMGSTGPLVSGRRGGAGAEGRGRGGGGRRGAGGGAAAAGAGAGLRFEKVGTGRLLEIGRDGMPGGGVRGSSLRCP